MKQSHDIELLFIIRQQQHQVLFYRRPTYLYALTSH